MLRLTDTGYYKIKVKFMWPKWMGAYVWPMYFDGIEFYHIQLSPSEVTNQYLNYRLAAEIKKHAPT